MTNCENCGREVEPDDGGAIWYHPGNMSMFCDGDESPDLLRQAEPSETAVPNGTDGAPTCEACGRSWLPDTAPSARCPFEYEHDSDDY